METLFMWLAFFLLGMAWSMRRQIGQWVDKEMSRFMED